MIAKFGGMCPLCDQFIVKGKSRIARLPAPMRPRGDGRFSADTGEPYSGRDARRDSYISMSPRTVCHERCLPRYGKPPKWRAITWNGEVVYEHESGSTPDTTLALHS
jgi:hypothetical protein